MEAWMVNIRRELHQWPELIYEEHNTSAAIRRVLDELDIPYKYPVAGTGVVASIGKGDPVVGLRADIDALPIHEQADVPFTSKNEGKMHACGHDSHTTMLLGAARLLKGMESQLKGSVRLFFQPAEEGGAGADRMIKEGAAQGLKAIFGFHVWPSMRSGHIGSRPGTILAGALSFEATINGRGGHAAMPHLTTDPVVASAAAVVALQSLVSRETSPLESAVVSVTRFSAGDGAFNVIPDTTAFGGTIRCLTHDGMMTLQKRVTEVIRAQAASFGCTADISWREEDQPYYPPTVNDKGAFEFAKDVGIRLLGDPSKFEEVLPTMAGEDFAFFGRAGIPASFSFLGINDPGQQTGHGLHTPRFKLDEAVLPLGAAYHTALATEFLDTYAATTGKRDEL
ncbi:hypothetical protein WJX72_004097 [[Myrmecia] bisecta]|uniref:Peptidase M20 dimerisation domain-containing protein n=1 Tax=[Myrmecia] bisecta TaxID=41462 RepID=A0AAW1R646_9CHLO